MKFLDMDTSKLSSTLKRLMEMKGKRDGGNFTSYQLAKAIDMPHSMLVRLIHPDPSKRVTNPRIDTLGKIIKFFRQDGFDVTIDHLLHGLCMQPEIAIQTQPFHAFSTEATLPVYSFNGLQEKAIGQITVKLTSTVKNLIAFIAEEEVKPLFKKGSIFIVDQLSMPENDMLVAVQSKAHNRIFISKFYCQEGKKWLEPLFSPEQIINLPGEEQYNIIGVVIQVNAKV